MDVKITEDYVSFETAKLLKEKGFLANDRIYKVYHLEDKSLTNSDGNFNHDTEIAAPTLQMALKWLRVIHNIIITIDFDKYEGMDNNIVIGFGFSIQKKEHPDVYYYVNNQVYDTHEEATEGAILYCINNEYLLKKK